MRTVAVDKLNRHARLGDLPQKLSRTIVARRIGEQAINLLAHLQTLVDLLECISVAAHAKFNALNRNAPVDDLLFKAIAAFPQVTEKYAPSRDARGRQNTRLISLRRRLEALVLR